MLPFLLRVSMCRWSCSLVVSLGCPGYGSVSSPRCFFLWIPPLFSRRYSFGRGWCVFSLLAASESVAVCPLATPFAWALCPLCGLLSWSPCCLLPGSGLLSRSRRSCSRRALALSDLPLFPLSSLSSSAVGLWALLFRGGFF